MSSNGMSSERGLSTEVGRRRVVPLDRRLRIRPARDGREELAGGGGDADEPGARVSPTESRLLRNCERRPADDRRADVLDAGALRGAAGRR